MGRGEKRGEEEGRGGGDDLKKVLVGNDELRNHEAETSLTYLTLSTSYTFPLLIITTVISSPILSCLILYQVATTINTVDCTVSTACSELNRDHCLLTPGTCGSCLPGYVGEQFIY